MDDAKRELVRAWLIKDLTTAREVGALADGPLDTALPTGCGKGGEGISRVS